MDYKEWFDKLCETHEREMKQAELRGYARGYRQGLESDVVPKPCNGPKYDDWRLGDFVMQITQEFCEMVDEYKAFRRGEIGAIDRFAYECTDLITATDPARGARRPRDAPLESLPSGRPQGHAHHQCRHALHDGLCDGESKRGGTGMTDVTFAQAASVAAWIALTVFLVAVSVGLIMTICTISKVWKKIMRQIDQDEAEAKRVREERRNLKW